MAEMGQNATLNRAHVAALVAGQVTSPDPWFAWPPRQTKPPSGARQEPKACRQTGVNHFILSRSQCRIITAEMIADGLAVDDRSKRAAEVAHIKIPVALLDHEMVAR